MKWYYILFVILIIFKLLKTIENQQLNTVTLNCDSKWKLNWQANSVVYDAMNDANNICHA